MIRLAVESSLMAENEEQREECGWRREVVLLALAMGTIAGFMVLRGWETVRPFDAKSFSYVSDITTTLVNLGLLYGALVRGRSLIKWVLRQWERLVTTSPRIRSMFLSLWPRRSTAKSTASGSAHDRDAGLLEQTAPISAGTEPSPDLSSHGGDQSGSGENTRRRNEFWRLGGPAFIVLTFVGALVGIVLLGNVVVKAWESLDQSQRAQRVVEGPSTPVPDTPTESETQDYIVPFRTPRVSCRLIARSFAPSRDGGAYHEIVRVNHLTDECRISYGTTIKLPAEWDATQPLN